MGRAYRVRVVLDQLDYPVWRSGILPGHYSQSENLLALKAMFGWPLDVEATAETRDGLFSEVRIGSEQWRHLVTVEEVMATERPLAYAKCIAGEGHRPPLDVGGPQGYEAFLVAVENPNHPEHFEKLAWAEKDTDGRMFDRKYFYILEVNRKLKALGAELQR